jgi:pimeloyl-ACP methyl ester carboxylesterase
MTRKKDRMKRIGKNNSIPILFILSFFRVIRVLFSTSGRASGNLIPFLQALPLSPHGISPMLRSVFCMLALLAGPLVAFGAEGFEAKTGFVTKEFKNADDTISKYVVFIPAWSIAAAFPDKWAAIVPICGGGNPKDAEKIKDIPCWCFHGDKDTAVKVERSQEMMEALKKAGGKPKYTEYPGVGHNSWDKAYAEKELWTWLAEQKK